MASPAVAVPQVNGTSPMPRPGSPSSIQSSTKRKRNESEESATELDTAREGNVAVNGTSLERDQKTLIRDYFDVLQRYALLSSINSLPHRSMPGFLFLPRPCERNAAILVLNISSQARHRHLCAQVSSSRKCQEG